MFSPCHVTQVLQYCCICPRSKDQKCPILNMHQQLSIISNLRKASTKYVDTEWREKPLTGNRLDENEYQEKLK
jgi:hypothetical protein